MSVYLDASFLVSFYSFDSNSRAAAKTALESEDALIITTFGELEVVNALGLRVFRQQASAEETRLGLEAFQDDLTTGRFQIRELPELVFRRARQVSLQTTARLGTRTGDLLHVAAALEFGAEGFYSFDKQQRNLAVSVKLRVNDWP